MPTGRYPAWSSVKKAALSLSMALHELMTNATKYGALSNDAGRVALTWARMKTAETERLDLRWEEFDGPSVTTPSRQGFGSRLITGGLARELGGDVRLEYPSTGVVCTISAALAKPGGPSRFSQGAA